MSVSPPRGWHATTLSGVATLSMGQSPPGTATNTDGIGLPLVGGASEFHQGRIVASRYTTTPTKVAEPDDIIFCIRATIGKVAVADRSVCLGRGVAGFRPTNADTNWLRYLLIHLAPEIDAAGTGTTFRQVDKQTLSNWPVLKPPLAEQRLIVAKLDSFAGKIARAWEQLGKIPNLVLKYREAILGAAFSGELTREWRLTHTGEAVNENVGAKVRHERDAERAKAEIRPKGKNRSVTGIVPILPAIPPQWGWITFEDCAWDLTVGHVGPMKDRYVKKGIPFLRSLNIKPNNIEWDSNTVFIDEAFDRELLKSRLRPGDLVVVRTGEPGVAAVVPKSLAYSNCSDLVIGRLIPSANPHYAAFYMNSEFAKSIVRDAQVGVAQQHFNVGSMSEMPIPWAPTAEQDEIVRRIETAFVWLDRVAAEHANASRLLPRLDQAILAKAFRGELVPQEPGDEPAATIFDPIPVERATFPKSEQRKSRSEIAIPTNRPAMPKNRIDIDVKGKPYLASKLKEFGGMTNVEQLYRAADLSLVDFYKQLSDEFDRGWLRKTGELVEVA